MKNFVEIVMRSKNDAPVVGRVLTAVHRQRCDAEIRLVHIDSGSTDETVDIIRTFAPWKLIQIRAEDYVPGRVLNQGMRETTGEWVVFLNSDAEPADTRWLGELLHLTQQVPHLAAAFSRQLPRRDCEAVYAHDYERCFGPQRESARWDHFFSMVSCIVSRRAWLEQPFREDLRYAEDDEWSRRVKTAGWNVAYAGASVAIHSHNYTLHQAWRRSRGDAFAHAATAPVASRWQTSWPVALAGAARDAARDWRWCRLRGRRSEWLHALTVRLAQRLGRTAGLRAGTLHYHA